MGIKSLNLRFVLFVVLLFVFVTVTQAQTIECKISAPINAKDSETGPNQPTTKTVTHHKNVKAKSSTEYFGMFKRLIPDISK